MWQIHTHMYIYTYMCIICIFYINIYVKYIFLYMGFPGGSAVKNLPATQQTQVRSLGQEDPLEEGMATYSREQ